MEEKKLLGVTDPSQKWKIGIGIILGLLVIYPMYFGSPVKVNKGEKGDTLGGIQFTSTFTISSSSVGTSSAVLSSANTAYTYRAYTNTGPNIVYIAPTSTGFTSSTGWPVYPNGGVLELYGETLWYGDLYEKTDTGTSTLSIMEFK